MKNLACILTLALSITLIQTGKAHAEFLSGFVVVEVSEQTVTVKKVTDGKQFVATKPADKLKVGNEVFFDESSKRVKRDLGGC